MLIFRLFELLVFKAYKCVFSFQNIIKDIFLALIAQKKKWEKWPFLDQNHALTPLEECQFFDFRNFSELLVFIALKGVFFFQKIIKDIFLAKIALKKIGKLPFLDQNYGLNPLKKCHIFDCLNFLFLQPRQAFFPSRIS